MLISHLSIHIHTQKWKIILLLDGNKKKMFVTHEKYHHFCIILHPPIKQILTYNMAGLCFNRQTVHVKLYLTNDYLPNCNFIMLDVGDVLLNIAYNKKLAKLKKKY